MKRTFSFIAILSFCLFSFVVPLSAAPQKSAKEKDLPASGALASSGHFGRGNTGADLPWGSTDGGITNGGSPISGSITRINPNEWQLKVFNNSKDSYSVSLQVFQYNSSGSKVKTDSLSYSLAPGKSAERKIPAGISSDRAELNLGNWKKLGGSKKSKETQSEEAAPKEGEGAEPVAE